MRKLKRLTVEDRIGLSRSKLLRDTLEEAKRDGEHGLFRAKAVALAEELHVYSMNLGSGPISLHPTYKVYEFDVYGDELEACRMFPGEVATRKWYNSKGELFHFSQRAIDLVTQVVDHYVEDKNGVYHVIRLPEQT